MLKYLFFIFVLGNYKKAVASKSYRRIYRHVEMIFFFMIPLTRTFVFLTIWKTERLY